MSAEATPITARAFAAAIEELPLSTLHLKAAELRNSLAHLEHSNAQLEPFARPPPGSSEQADDVCVEAIEENIAVMARYKERLGLLKREAEKRGLDWEELEKLFTDADVVAGTAEESEMNLEEREVLRSIAAGGGNTAARMQQTRGGDGATDGVAGGEERMMLDGQRVGTHSAWTDGTFQMGRINAQGEIVMDVDPAAPPRAAADSGTNGVATNADIEDIQGVTAPTMNGVSARQGGSLNDEELRRRMAEQMGEDEEGLYL